MQKHFEKGKKDNRRLDSRETFQDSQRKKKLKPTEKTKYKFRGFNSDSDEDDD